ncbi:hypothetical protein GCM10022204_03890 [Microlunatus aurantiacus]|uniref:Beta-lactamase-related domain-containing protein n=1 Tax=Microlunatus aurantiacus TaxID=446786 RepID=A0ABP7CJF1_9ACTN
MCLLERMTPPGDAVAVPVVGRGDGKSAATLLPDSLGRSRCIVGHCVRASLSTAVLCCLIVCVACVQGQSEVAPAPTPAGDSASRADRAQEVLELLANVDEPGCSAAVAQRGEVVWRGVQGLADLASKSPITASTVFDIGSVSKQFTAAAVLLLRDAGKLQLEDPLADHLTEFPGWSQQTTLAHLMHHTSGIPDYQRLLEDQGFELSERTTQRQAVEALARVRVLDFSTGSNWAYSNSNYVLLAEVVRKVSGRPLGQYLTTEIFEPLNLDMVVEPNARVPGKAVSYRDGAGQYEVVDHQWEQVGDGAIQTTPAELARWGDNYRTGEVGGADWQAAVVADAVDVPPGPTGEKNRYGAGIVKGEKGWLGHPGGWEGFVTSFWVSPDRATSVVVACNKYFDLTDLEKSLIEIWSPI